MAGTTLPVINSISLYCQTAGSKHVHSLGATPAVYVLPCSLCAPMSLCGAGTKHSGGKIARCAQCIPNFRECVVSLRRISTATVLLRRSSRLSKLCPGCQPAHKGAIGSQLRVSVLAAKLAWRQLLVWTSTFNS